MRLHFGWCWYTRDFRLHIEWGYHRNPPEGCSRFRHTLSVTFMTMEDYNEMGLLALSPVTFRRCRHLYGDYDADGVVTASTIRSESWTGRQFEVTHVLVSAVGRRWFWRL